MNSTYPQWETFDTSKLPNQLVPAIIQDSTTLQVLMLGYMNEEAYTKTISEGKVTFYSRTRQALWTKGETSGHYLELVSISIDCDKDTLLIRAIPHGPTCHTGSKTCWGEQTAEGLRTRMRRQIQSWQTLPWRSRPRRSSQTPFRALP